MSVAAVRGAARRVFASCADRFAMLRPTFDARFALLSLLVVRTIPDRAYTIQLSASYCLGDSSHPFSFFQVCLIRLCEGARGIYADAIRRIFEPVAQSTVYMCIDHNNEILV